MNTTNEIPCGLCHCGCGQKTTLATSSSANRGLVKGKPIKFVHGHNMRTRGDHSLYADGKSQHNCGYVWKRCDGHPKAHNGYVLEHVLVAEQKIGRFLTDDEVVHHESEIKSDNRPENLIVFPNESEHRKHHVRMKALKACGNPDWRRCKFCRNYDAPEHLRFVKHAVYHPECKRIYDRAYKLTLRN